MNEINFNGALSERFKSPVIMDIATPREAIRALCCQLPGFREFLKEGSYVLLRGDPEAGIVLGEQELDLGMGSQPLHIYPVVEGRGGDNGAIKAIIGTMLIAAAFIINPAAGATTASILSVDVAVKTAASISYAVASLGINLALTGVSMMLAPSPQGLDPNSNELKQTSFIFNGAINVSEQGHPVPLVIGHIRTGSVVISAGIENEQMRALPSIGFIGGGEGAGIGGYTGPSSGYNFGVFGIGLSTSGVPSDLDFEETVWV